MCCTSEIWVSVATHSRVHIIAAFVTIAPRVRSVIAHVYSVFWFYFRTE